MGQLDISGTALGAGVGEAPQHITGVVVVGREADAVVVGVEEDAGEAHTLRGRGPHTVGTRTLSLVHEHIGDITVVVAGEAHVHAAGADDGKTADLKGVALHDADGADVHTVTATDADVVADVAEVAVLAGTLGVAHTDGTAARQTEVLLAEGVEQGHIARGVVGGPVDTRHGDVVTEAGKHLIVGNVVGLPQDGSLLDPKLHEATDIQVGHHKAAAHVHTAMDIPPAGADHRTAARVAHVVNGGLDGVGIVGEAVALGTEVQNRHGVIG